MLLPAFDSKNLSDLCGEKEMEVDFDKEIDALLLKAHRDDPVLVGDFASRHLDADEISAFAENAMPENSRALYMSHLADCDRCRKILSNLLVMNAEAAPAAASPSVITIAERSEPWYRRLFLFPNLAYVMGSLVLIFAGFLGYTVLKNSTGGDAAVVSQATEEDSRGGPNFQSEPSYSDSGAISTNTMANSAANMMTSNSTASAANTNAGIGRGPMAAANSAAETESELRDDKKFVLDGVSSADTVAPAPPPATQPAPKDVPRERDELAKEKVKNEDKGAGLLEAAKPSNDLSLMSQTQLPRGAAGPNKQSGPSRNNQEQYNRQLENLDRRAAARKVDKSLEESSSGGKRVVSGKTFERKQGVWYDTTYQGRPTINVRRGSAEFNRLDGGLRSIANSLSGTAVIVWGAKAYRIQ